MKTGASVVLAPLLTALGLVIPPALLLWANQVVE